MNAVPGADDSHDNCTMSFSLYNVFVETKNGPMGHPLWMRTMEGLSLLVR